MDLNHCHLQVKSLKKARAFYQDFFGFELDFECEEFEVFLKNRDCFALGLEQVEKAEALPAWFHLGFGCKDEAELKASYEKFRAAEYPMKRELKDFGSSLNFYLADPDGNQIEVYFNRS